MTHSLRSWMRAGLVPAAVVLALGATGCSSDPGPGERRAARKPPTPMAGHETFFDGQILAEISVGTDGMPETGPGGGGIGQRGPGGGGRGRRGGGGGLGMQAGAGGFAGNVAGNLPFGEGGERPSRGEGGPRPGLGGGGRPVMIHLRFTNQTPASVTVGIADFVSPLGNFAVRPEQLTVEAGQSLETEPMTSQLAGALSEVNVALALRLNGKPEKKIFTLHALPPGQPPAPASGESAQPNAPKS